jgi:putative hemolysin
MKKITIIVLILVASVLGYFLYAKKTSSVPAEIPNTNNNQVVPSELNIDVVCQDALAYMTFQDGAKADKFVSDCKEGKYPEVIEKYKADMANPASVYCNEHDGQSIIRTASDGSQLGICVFENGNECDEWLFFRGECTASSPVPGIEKAVQAFLANKYKKSLSEVKVTIQKEAPGYAAGSVLFGQDGQGEGGMWLAIAGNLWDVVWDGNGSVDCNKMRQEYGFPDAILKPNFCD